MSSPVAMGFRNVAGIAALAIAADLWFNRGQIVRAFACGILGTVVLGKSKQNEIKYRMIPHLFNELPEDQEALKRALARVEKNYPVEYQKVLKKNELLSEEKILTYFSELFSRGTCSGVTNALFDKIHRKESRSLKESASRLNFDDIFYHHILQELCIKRIHLDLVSEMELMKKKIEFNDKKILEVKEFLSSNSSLLSIKMEPIEGWDTVKKQIRDHLEKDLIHVGKDYHSSTFPESSKFLIQDDTLAYQNSLKEVTLQFPGEDDFVGYVHTPNHLIAFQYGKSGYYLYDPFAAGKGLFEYPDSQTFFQELKRHVVEDIIYTKGRITQEKNPTITLKVFKANVEELVKNTNGYFGARPLNKINVQESA